MKKAGYGLPAEPHQDVKKYPKSFKASGSLRLLPVPEIIALETPAVINEPIFKLLTE